MQVQSAEVLLAQAEVAQLPLDALPDAITLLLTCAKSEALALAAHRSAAAAADATPTMGAGAVPGADATSTMGASAVRSDATSTMGAGAVPSDATSTMGAGAVPGADATSTMGAGAMPGAPAEGSAEEAAHAIIALGDFLSEELTGAVLSGAVLGTFAALALQPLARRPARGVNEFISLLLGCLMTNGATAELLHRSSAALLELLEVNCMLIAL